MRTRLVAFVAIACLAACSDNEAPKPPVPGAVGPAPATPLVVAKKPNATPSEPLPPLPSTDTDPDSVEASRLRDPFQTGLNLERITDDEATQRLLEQRRTTVPFSDIPVTDLHVRGTVNDGQTPRAIITDANGHTQMVSVGMIIGREMRDRKGAVSQWKVDRIRDGQVILAQSGGPETSQSRTHILANG